MTFDHLREHLKTPPKSHLAALCCLAILSGCAQVESANEVVRNDVLEIETLTSWPDEELPPISEALPESFGTEADMTFENRTVDKPGD